VRSFLLGNLWDCVIGWVRMIRWRWFHLELCRLLFASNGRAGHTLQQQKNQRCQIIYPRRSCRCSKYRTCSWWDLLYFQQVWCSVTQT
jgi:hypothetical protein